MISSRIEQILGVLRYIQSRFSRRDFSSVEDLRREGTEEVANRLGIDKTTVSDKYRRQLYPDVRNTDHFDQLLQEWFDGHSHSLKQSLLSHCTSHEDERAIRDFFE